MAGDSFFPLEVLVAGTPRSLGAVAASRERWKGQVQTVARHRLAESTDLPWLDVRSLAMTIFYFPPAVMEGDIDNIIKPIMDALVGFAYLNDQCLERVLAQKFEPDDDWSFEQPSELLASALDADAPIVYIRIDDDLAWRQN